MSTSTTKKHIIISTLASLSLPALIFVIACLVRDIDSIEDGLLAFMFLSGLAVFLFLSYWLLGAIQTKQETRSIKTSVWYSAMCSVLFTFLMAGFAAFIGVKPIQIFWAAIFVFPLSWLVHLTGSLTQYVQMSGKT